MQSIIPDTMTATAAENNFIPAFKENQPGAGLVKMVMVFDNVIRDSKPASLPFSPQQLKNIGLLIVLGLVIFLFLRGRNNGGGSDGGLYGGESGGSGGGDGGGSSTSF